MASHKVQFKGHYVYDKDTQLYLLDLYANGKTTWLRNYSSAKLQATTKNLSVIVDGS